MLCVFIFSYYFQFLFLCTSLSHTFAHRRADTHSYTVITAGAWLPRGCFNGGLVFGVWPPVQIN